MTSTVTRERPLKREIPRREKTTITKGVGYAQENDIHGNRQPKIFEVAISGAAKALLRLRDEGTCGVSE